ncbi:hypothetical protein C8R47DRAFT_1083362 [Mycena vitilis]|nr:hypothetical protein C8R47DRAFT_1083360 [Mycena vitilis]KAJ6453617.1 hypothetical protein C8R47DRAFT_1083362 [Mycena vitilis]
MSSPITPAAAVAAAHAAAAASFHDAAFAASFSLSFVMPLNVPADAQHRLAIALMDLSFGAVAQLPPQHGAQSSAQRSPAAWRQFKLLESSNLNDADFVEFAEALLVGDDRADRRGPSGMPGVLMIKQLHRVLLSTLLSVDFHTQSQIPARAPPSPLQGPHRLMELATIRPLAPPRRVPHPRKRSRLCPHPPTSASSLPVPTTPPRRVPRPLERSRCGPRPRSCTPPEYFHTTPPFATRSQASSCGTDELVIPAAGSRGEPAPSNDRGPVPARRLSATQASSCSTDELNIPSAGARMEAEEEEEEDESGDETDRYEDEDDDNSSSSRMGTPRACIVRSLRLVLCLICHTTSHIIIKTPASVCSVEAFAWVLRLNSSPAADGKRKGATRDRARLHVIPVPARRRCSRADCRRVGVVRTNTEADGMKAVTKVQAFAQTAPPTQSLTGEEDTDVTPQRYKHPQTQVFYHMLDKLKQMNFNGKKGFIGCQNFATGQKHWFVTINRDVDEELLLDLPYTHVDVNGIVTQEKIVRCLCPTTIRIFAPVDRENCRAIIYVSGTHSHPQLPCTKLSREEKDAYMYQGASASATWVTESNGGPQRTLLKELAVGESLPEDGWLALIRDDDHLGVGTVAQEVVAVDLQLEMVDNQLGLLLRRKALKEDIGAEGVDQRVAEGEKVDVAVEGLELRASSLCSLASLD